VEPVAVDGACYLLPVEAGRHAPALAARLFEAVHQSRAHLAPWLPWCTSAYDLAAAQAYLEEPSPERRFLLLSREADDAASWVLGAFGLLLEDGHDRAWKLGYWIREDATGRGLGRRGAAAAAHYAFTVLGALRLTLLIAVHNRASQRVAEAIGAEREGCLRQRLRLPSGQTDAYVYGLLPEALAPAWGPPGP
jgi:RimJ/RimL family protein N-acetyltransferase